MSTTAGTHILLFPFPAPGHIIPLLDLTRLLLTRGLTITVLVTPTYRPLLEPILSCHPSSSIQPLVLSPPVVPASSKLPFFDQIHLLRELHDPILHWFQSHLSPPVAIISDFILGWTHHLACQVGVPRLVFWASGAFTSSVSSCAWRELPRNDEPGNENFLISFPKIPNSPVYPWWQLFFLYRKYMEGDPNWEFFKNDMLANMASWGVVFNSFGELEGVYIDHLKKYLGHDRIWAVGPLLPPEDDFVGPTIRGNLSSVPIQELMAWLDQKADNSVVYICFGSRAELTTEQIHALAVALECSRVHFLWCVRATDEGHVASSVFPDGFEERMERRGLVVRGWAPQVAILRHRAVGVFVTHCGWNSVLEGLSTGVMMLTWPMGIDQFTNAKLLVDQLGVAVRACEGGDKIVPDSAELALLFAESVGGDRPEKARVKQLRQAALDAIQVGSSSKELDELVEKLHELKSSRIVKSGAEEEEMSG